MRVLYFAVFRQPADMLGRPKSQRLYGFSRLPPTGCHEAAAIADKQVRHIVGAMIFVHHRGRRVVAHASGPQQVRGEGLRPDRVLPDRLRARGLENFGGPVHQETGGREIVRVIGISQPDAGQAIAVHVLRVQFDAVAGNGQRSAVSRRIHEMRIPPEIVLVLWPPARVAGHATERGISDRRPHDPSIDPAAAVKTALRVGVIKVMANSAHLHAFVFVQRVFEKSAGRTAAVEQLNVYARIMGLSISVVTGKAELKQALADTKDSDVVFIDTAGRSQRDGMQMSELRKLFGGEQEIEIALTLSTTTKDSDLTDITRRFGEMPISSVLFTKLDESTTYGSLINHCIRFKMPIGYLSTGQKVPEDLEVATKERLVDLLLNISGA